MKDVLATRLGLLLDEDNIVILKELRPTIILLGSTIANKTPLLYKNDDGGGYTLLLERSGVLGGGRGQNMQGLHWNKLQF